MMMIFLVFVILGLIFYHCYLHYGRRGRIINKIPGPKNFPIFGSVIGYMLPTDKLWLAQRLVNAKYYPINKVWLGGTPVISIYHPDDVQMLLSSTKHIEKSMLYKFLHPWLGSGLLTSSGDKWQKRRKMLTPAFHFGILQGFVEVFVEQGENLVNRLKLMGDVVIEDIVPLLTECTLNSICQTAMGTSLQEMDTQNVYGSAIREVSDNLFFRALRPWLHFDWIFNLTPTGIRQQNVVKILHGFSNKIIKNRQKDKKKISHGKEKFSLSSVKKDLEDKLERKVRMAMLDVLITAANENGEIDDTGIREEVDTFVFEGTDTTAMGLCFTVLLLAENKIIQEIARTEVYEVLTESDGKMGMTEINRLNYLDRCIKEALRLFPSVPGIARVIDEDLQLKNYLAPAGTNIHLHIFDLHRDPKFWPNPLVYDPDRFLPEKVQNRHSFSYIPFSAGPRNCIGQKFAMLEIKALVAHILYNFDMEAIDESQNVILLQDLTMRPGQPLRVKFRTRNVQ